MRKLFNFICLIALIFVVILIVTDKQVSDFIPTTSNDGANTMPSTQSGTIKYALVQTADTYVLHEIKTVTLENNLYTLKTTCENTIIVSVELVVLYSSIPQGITYIPCTK